MDRKRALDEADGASLPPHSAQDAPQKRAHVDADEEGPPEYQRLEVRVPAGARRH